MFQRRGIRPLVALLLALAGCEASGAVDPEADAPTRVVDLAVTSSGTSAVTLRWTAVSDGDAGAAGYAVRYGTPMLQWETASGTEEVVASAAVGSPVSYVVDGLLEDTPYEFQVVSYRGTLDVDAVFGALSNKTSAATSGGAVPPALSPGAVTALAGSGLVTLGALAPTGGNPPYAYQWHGGISDPGLNPAAGTALAGLTSLNAVHNGAANGTTYYYRLVVTDEDGATAVSGMVSATPTAMTGASTLLHETWAGGISTARWSSGYEPAIHSVVQDPTGSGRGAVLRAVHADNGGAGYLAYWPYTTGQQNPTGELFLRAWIYVPANFDNADYAKMLIIKGNRTDNLFSSFGQAGIRPNGTNFFESYTSYGAPAHSDTGVHFYTYHVDMPGTFGDIASTRSAPLAARRPAPGSWHKFEFWLRQNTVGQSNGEQRIWMDDALILEWTGLRFRTQSILQANCIALTFTTSNNLGQTWYVDDVHVLDRMPSGMAGW